MLKNRTLLVLLVLTGCAGATLKPGAEKILELKEEKVGCVLLKTISAKAESETKSPEEIRAVAEIDLRNQTLLAGGDAFFVTEVKDGERRNATGHLSKTRTLLAKALGCQKK